MATKEQVKEFYVKKNISRKIADVTFGGVIAELTPAIKDVLLFKAKAGQEKAVGSLFITLVREAAKTLAEAEADTVLADDSISLDEIEKFR